MGYNGLSNCFQFYFKSYAASFFCSLSNTGLNMQQNLNFDSFLRVGQVVIPIGIWVLSPLFWIYKTHHKFIKVEMASVSVIFNALVLILGVFNFIDVYQFHHSIEFLVIVEMASTFGCCFMVGKLTFAYLNLSLFFVRYIQRSSFHQNDNPLTAGLKMFCPLKLVWLCGTSSTFCGCIQFKCKQINQ